MHLKTYEITPAVVRCPPDQRGAFLEKRVARWIKTARRDWPSDSFRIEPDSTMPTTIASRLAAREVSKILKFPGVDSVSIRSIQGMRRKRPSRDLRSWWCVRALIALEVEGQKRGLQTIEDRFVLVKAISAREAPRRLRRHWREYAAPYLNSEGLLVRFQLQEVTDVYDTMEDELDPDGVEVYSSLASRRMKPAFSWDPRRGGGA